MKETYTGGMRVNAAERISQEVSEKTGCMPGEFRLIREKDGISVYRCTFDGHPAVAKHFVHDCDRREIRHYRMLSRLHVPTMRVFALCDHCILMEDIDASDQWRLGTEEDMQDPEVLRGLAHWYFALHDSSGRHPRFQGMYSENDELNESALRLIREKLPDAGEMLDYVGGELERFRDILEERSGFLTYNDFYYTNLIVRKNKSAAMMFDYHCMGQGYRYADFRNVQSSVSEAAFSAFMEEYDKLYRAGHGEAFSIDRYEQQLDEFIAPLLGLANALRRVKFPAWAEEARIEAQDGTLLARARDIIEAENRKRLKRQLHTYAPYNEQEERDLEIILDCLASEKERKEKGTPLAQPDGNGAELFTRDSAAMHMTASAWVVSPDRKYVLMAYHNLYQSWAWLGGHADGEADLMQVARREVMEESGVKNVRPLMNAIFSVEVLPVFGHVKRGKYVSTHLHLNVTYLFEADMDEALKVKADENSAVGWIPAEEVSQRVSEPWMMERIYSKLMEKAEKFDRM